MKFDIEQTLQRKFETLPDNMNVSDVSVFLGVSIATAYNLAHSPDFPRLKTPGRRLVIIPKSHFIKWYIENCVTASELNH